MTESTRRMGTDGPSIVILTGAGISAESGIKTFRDHNGLWENHRIEDVASPEGFARDPDLVQNFYNLRRAQLRDPSVQPNAAHIALAELEQNWRGPFLLVTQNSDDLHERAGSKNLIHMHGELSKVRCLKTGVVFNNAGAIEAATLCECCRLAGQLRPHIVWFGEMPFQMDVIYERLSDCEIFIAIGTSGQVYPAAGFVQNVRDANPHSRRIEINAEASAVSRAFSELRRGPATHETAKLMRELLGRA